MKVISLVPSWTEMLLEAKVNVVGRTRFCIHPQDQVKSIAVVGGTKDLNWEKVQELKPDLLLLDQEENLPWMAKDSPVPVLVTHVTSLQNVANEIRKIADAFPAQKLSLQAVAERWDRILKAKVQWDWNQIPAEIETLRRDFKSYEKLIYVIWKKPWMRVANDTFVDSMLSFLGAEAYLQSSEKKYPEFEPSDFDLQKTYFLFSSEPFPFHRKKQELLDLGFQGSVVDGESFSWFGIRSLNFLGHVANKRS